MSSRAWPARRHRGASSVPSGVTSGSPRRDTSSGSVRSWRSAGSIRSILSAGSILSVASAGSILSVGSAGSILSIGSAGSILSVGSAGSILSIRSAGGILCRDNEPIFPSVSRSAVRPRSVTAAEADGLEVRPDAGEPEDAQIIDLRRAAGQSPSA